MSGKVIRKCLLGIGKPVCVGLLVLSVSPAYGQERIGLTQNPMAGSHVFGTKGCVKCHSVNGLGGTIGPDLGRIARRRSFFDLAATMWNHLPVMLQQMDALGIERTQMNEREAGDLIAFLFTLDYFDAPGNVEVGKRLFVEKRCVVCHQVGVYGGVMGPSLDNLGQYGSPILVAAAMWNHGPGMEEMMEERGVERPTFSGTELTDLISYLESVSPPPLGGPLYVLPGDSEEGRVIFTEKSCIECHGVDGVGGRVGPDLSSRDMHWGLTEFAAAMWNKAPAMTAAMKARDIKVPQLGAGEMADLVAYLYSVQYFAEAGDPDAGKRILGQKGCLDCHSLGGQGGDAAADLLGATDVDSPARVIAEMWSHSELMMAAGITEETWPRLEADQLADITAFLQISRQNR
jgi:cytochrome c551/c552